MHMPAPCSGAGNYNPVLGACVCAIGFNGTRCERRALPACRARPDSTAVSCPVGRPQHCDCYAQCLANGAFEGHMYRFCFRTGGTGEALSAVPAADQAASFFERRGEQWQPVARAAALRHEFQAELERAWARDRTLRRHRDAPLTRARVSFRRAGGALPEELQRTGRVPRKARRRGARRLVQVRPVL